MTPRLAITCLLTMASLSFTGCDRVKSLLTPAGGTPATTAEVCADPTTGPDLSAERAAEARALAAHAEMAKRDRDTLKITYAGKVVATAKACDSFFRGQVRLINSKTGTLDTYPVFMTGMNQSIVVDHDGTPFLFEGTVIASPDGHYLASGEAHQDYMNENLTLTDWTSASHAQVEFPINCSPLSWGSDGLKAECDAGDTSPLFTEATAAPDKDEWILRETAWKVPASSPHERGPLQTFTSGVVWPEDVLDWIDPSMTTYRPMKGAALPGHLPNRVLALRDDTTGKITSYTLSESMNNFVYRVTPDGLSSYDVSRNPKASPDGRMIANAEVGIPLLDWSRKVEIDVEDVVCLDGEWASPTELKAWCYGEDVSIAPYVEAHLTRDASGQWTYQEVSPARRTIAHTWQTYTAKGFTPRRRKGRDGRQMLNSGSSERVIA